MASQRQGLSLQFELSKDMSEFSVNLYKLFAGDEGNMFLSPYSVCAALLLTSLGGKGDTESEVRKALGFSYVDPKDVHLAYRNLREALKSRTKGRATLAVANRLFAKLGLGVLESFEVESKMLYDSGIETMDFIGKPEESRASINNWVEKHTQQKIKDLLPHGSITDHSLVVLVNAIYFKGKWKDPFKVTMTKKEKFHISATRSGTVDMMNMTTEINLHRDVELGCSAVELPYESDSIVMVIILPDKIDGLKALEDSLTGTALYDFCNILHTKWWTDVILGLPKFKLESKYNITNGLKQLGIKAMMDPTTADFGGIFKTPDGAFISEAIHNAFVEVNEEGTEAAAATAMMMVDGCAPIRNEPEKFVADHPFIFLIRDTHSGTVLFMGRYTTPPTLI